MAEKVAGLTIKGMLQIGLAVLFLPLLLLGGSYYAHLYQSINQQIRHELQENSRALESNFITPYLNDLMHEFNVLFAALDEQQFEQAPDQAEHQDWQLLFDFRRDVQLFYYGSESDTTHSYPYIEIPTNYRPTERPWYQAALDNLGKATWSEPYLNYESDDLVITLSRTLLDSRGRVQGVFAMDTELGVLNERMEPYRQQTGGWQGLMTDKGRFLAHSDNEQVWKTLPHPEWLERISAGVEGGFFDEAAGLFVSWRRLDSFNWILLSVMPADAAQQTLDGVMRYVLAIVGLSMLLYLVLASVYSSKVKRMLDNLIEYFRLAWSNPTDLPRNLKHPELRELYEEIQEASWIYHEANRRANRDRLTGVYNRYYLDHALDELMQQKRSFSLGMFDLDNFKSLNDTYGHPVGDTVLKRVAKLCEELLDKQGAVIRYGGEEFIVIIYSELGAATRQFEQIRLAVEQLAWREPDMITTFSGGLVGWNGQDGKALVQTADELVYKAKRSGKNRICAAPGYVEETAA